MRIKDLKRNQLRHFVSMYLSNKTWSYADCARACEVPVGTFIKGIERAIVESAATDKEVYYITEKATDNCFRHGAEGGAERARAKYDRLRAQRAVFRFPNDTKVIIAKHYLELNIDFRGYCRQYYLPFHLMTDVIETVIKENLLPEAESKELVEKLLRDKYAIEVLSEYGFRDFSSPEEKKKEFSEQLSLFADDFSTKLRTPD